MTYQHPIRRRNAQPESPRVEKLSSEAWAEVISSLQPSDNSEPSRFIKSLLNDLRAKRQAAGHKDWGYEPRRKRSHRRARRNPVMENGWLLRDGRFIPFE